MKYNFDNINVESIFSDESRQHCTIYIDLRQVISKHILSQNESQLSLCTSSKKEQAWQLSLEFNVRDEWKNQNQEMIIFNENIENNAEFFVDFEEAKV